MFGETYSLGLVLDPHVALLLDQWVTAKKFL